LRVKITEKDLVEVNQNPLELYYQGIKSEQTREKYTRTLRRILCETLDDILSGTFEERAVQLVKKAKVDPDWALSILLTLAKKQRDRTKLDPSHSDYLNPVSFDNTFKPLKKLFDMNDVPIVWNRVYATFPEQNNSSLTSTRGYTREEIQRMLNFAKGAMDRAVILVAASSGIRPGAVNFNWNDITPVYKVDDKIVLEITESETTKAEIVCAMITIYRKTFAEIPAFITPEAYNSLIDWKKEWTKEVGREPKDGEPVFKQAGPFEKPTTPEAIKRRIERVLSSSGILFPVVKGKKRREVPVMNGFRRFFNKTNKETLSKDSPLAALIKKEYMMDHTGLVKLDRNYFKIHVIELIEEYLQAVPSLTINDSERLRAQNRIKDQIIKHQESEKDAIIKNLTDRMEKAEKILGKLDKVN